MHPVGCIFRLELRSVEKCFRALLVTPATIPYMNCLYKISPIVKAVGSGAELSRLMYPLPRRLALQLLTHAIGCANQITEPNHQFV
jgi:hypothetical protein